MTCSEKTRAKFEKEGYVSVYCLTIFDELDRIIWSEGGSVAEAQNPQGMLVRFPKGTEVVDLHDCKCEELACHVGRWAYKVPSKDKLIWVLARLDGELPVLSRVKSPWIELQLNSS